MLIWVHNQEEVLTRLFEWFPDYVVSFEFSEPGHNTASGWKLFRDCSKLNKELFGRYVKTHIDYWKGKALAPIKIVSITSPIDSWNDFRVFADAFSKTAETQS